MFYAYGYNKQIHFFIFFVSVFENTRDNNIDNIIISEQVKRDNQEFSV